MKYFFATSIILFSFESEISGKYKQPFLLRNFIEFFITVIVKRVPSTPVNAGTFLNHFDFFATIDEILKHH